MPRNNHREIATEQDRVRYELLKAFGAVLQETRRTLGWTQDELAMEAGTDRSFISLLERGFSQPSLLMLVRLSGAAGIAPSDLLERVIQRWASNSPVREQVLS